MFCNKIKEGELALKNRVHIGIWGGRQHSLQIIKNYKGLVALTKIANYFLRKRMKIYYFSTKKVLLGKNSKNVLIFGKKLKKCYCLSQKLIKIKEKILDELLCGLTQGRNESGIWFSSRLEFCSKPGRVEELLSILSETQMPGPGPHHKIDFS